MSRLRLLNVLCTIFLCSQIDETTSNVCKHLNPFHLTINKEPEYYVPKTTYIVGIESNDVYPFISFTLSSELLDNETSTITGPPAGWFHLMSDDMEVQFSPDAINIIMEQDTSPKQNVHVLWTAPSIRNCIVFKAQVSYKFQSEMCTQELQRRLCVLTEQPPSVVDDECCACDEAAYTMVFEGLWSSETHPKHFPKTLQLTHFSDIIGCTHSRNLTMWAEGLYASEGMRQVAEYGSGTIIESELLEKRKHLRSLIKLNGLWYPKMNSNTSTKFKVDKHRHLLSLATMLGPSPDWFTGISKLNLCTKNCTWVENKVVDLTLYDAGTDSGLLYMSPDAPIIPPERIYRITGSYPEDPRSPFYNINEDAIKPIARLYLNRDRVMSKSCSEPSPFEMDDSDFDENSEKFIRPECNMTKFSEWSPCSATCGKGFSTRSRNYTNPIQAKLFKCNRRVVLKKLCMVETLCPGETVDADDLLLLSDENCKTTEWSEWSECTATCGIGFMTRSRRFLKHSAYKKCKHVSVLEKKKCMEPPCKTTVVEREMTNCTTTEWSDWSPCSVTCGKGIRIRVRHLIAPKEIYKMCKEHTKLEERRECIRTKECVIDKSKAHEVCQQPKEKGPCRGVYQRWYFNAETKQCVEFAYGGCRGNRNNFLSLDECIKICSALFP